MIHEVGEEKLLAENPCVNDWAQGCCGGLDAFPHCEELGMAYCEELGEVGGGKKT